MITNRTIPVPSCEIGACPVPVDLDRDGIADFQFSLGTFHYHEAIFGSLNVRGLAGGEAVGAAGGYFPFYASALLRGEKIGPSVLFVSNPPSNNVTIEGSERCTYFCDGSYARSFEGKWGGNHPNRFLGVRFFIDGKTHFGWVRITVRTNPSGMIMAQITEYGYETIANKAVAAGMATAGTKAEQAREKAKGMKGASLGMLALGAVGMNLWRREPAVR
jgi:hypothetical protein